ncbi:MAG: MCE family protein [Candidatus Brocadiae bacterium]|nr:MCE family protein [Candidatus Brocadiia bacterium]
MKASKDFLVGILFFSGLILVGIFTVVIKDLPTLKGTYGKLSVMFDRVSGLEKGHKVLASGMEVGQVSELELQEDGSVRVGINLTHNLKLFKGYKISVKDASALGGKYVNIELGNKEEGPLAVTPLGYMEEKLQPLDGSAQPSLLDDPNLRDTLQSLKSIAKKIDQGQGTVGLLINQREIYDDIKKAATNIREITEQVRSTQGTIGKLLYDSNLYEKIQRIISNVENITETVRSGKGTLGKLVNDEAVYNSAKATLDDAKKTMANLSEITEQVKQGKGTIGKLFTDEKVYNELERALSDARTMMNNINEIAKQINSGQGTLGTLLKDEETAKNVKETLANIKVVSERLEKGEGTVGKLLSDDTLYKEIRRVVKSISDSMEDAREQVPITTFTGLLFKAF